MLYNIKCIYNIIQYFCIILRLLIKVNERYKKNIIMEI